jgi:membrane-associated PAP2 superfamily phosphatase
MPTIRSSYKPTFWRAHFYYPLIAFVKLASPVQLWGVNRLIADHLNACQGGQRALKDAWLTSQVIHKIGKYLSLLIALLILIGNTPIARQ